jgi:hypothetical protein
LVEQDIAFCQAEIGRHKVAHPYVDDITRDESLRGDLGPRAIAADPRQHTKLRAEEVERVAGSALVRIAHAGVDEEQRDEDDRLDVLAERDLEHERRFEHRRDGPDELAKDDGYRPGAALRRRIRSELA